VGVNTVGLQRNAVSEEDMAAVKRAFRQLFWADGTMAARIATVLATPLGTVPLVRQICEFVASSERGVCMPRNGRTAPAGVGENESDAET
jgi:UDP-N-acetylglucosamine acyltransferase